MGPLASSSLHQPYLPQGSGYDWLLSPPAHDKRASLTSSRSLSSPLLSFHLIPSHSISSPLLSSLFLSSHLIESPLIPSYLNSSPLLASHLISSHLASSHFISSPLLSSHLLSSPLISSCLVRRMRTRCPKIRAPSSGDPRRNRANHGFKNANCARPQTQLRLELREGAKVHAWRKNLKSHLRWRIGLEVIATINANRSNVRATIRDRLFTGSIEQVQMANIQAFQELQLMICMRQFVFARMDRGGQRGYANVTPEVELDEGETLPAEVVAPEEEPPSANQGLDLVGEPPQVETANEIQVERSSSEVVVSSAAPRREEFLPVSHNVTMWHRGQHCTTTLMSEHRFSLRCVKHGPFGCQCAVANAMN